MCEKHIAVLLLFCFEVPPSFQLLSSFCIFSSRLRLSSLAIILFHSFIIALNSFYKSILFYDDEDDKFWHILPGRWCGAAAELIWEFFVLRQLNGPNQPDQTSSQKL